MSETGTAVGVVKSVGVMDVFAQVRWVAKVEAGLDPASAG